MLRHNPFEMACAIAGTAQKHANLVPRLQDMSPANLSANNIWDDLAASCLVCSASLLSTVA
jgi:hypothetical protein